MVNFLKYTWFYVVISAVTICLGLSFLILYGYKYSIDFVGGTTISYQVTKKISEKTVGDIGKKQQIAITEIKMQGNALNLRTKPIDEKQEANFRQSIDKQTNQKIKMLNFETVGPVLGGETVRKTIIASILAICGILIYMSFAFKGFNYAVSAIIAMIHDFVVVMGLYSVLSKVFTAEVDTMFVTAVLTTMSFSVHDTIVIFDKIREYTKTHGKGDLKRYANKAVTETMVRSLNNSMTIVFMLLALILLGGTTIRFFVVTLLIGTITGTYSSPFVATPILVFLENRKK